MLRYRRPLLLAVRRHRLLLGCSVTWPYHVMIPNPTAIKGPLRRHSTVRPSGIDEVNESTETLDMNNAPETDDINTTIISEAPIDDPPQAAYLPPPLDPLSSVELKRGQQLIEAHVAVVAGYPSLVESALAASERFRQVREATRVAEEAKEQIELPKTPWRDDTAAEKRAQERHYKSPEYRELHRSHITNAGLGLYGGEPGFEASPRQYVDPDRPHLKTFYNNEPVHGNLRYSRYGHFKKELHLIDVDKLIRHARLLPPPSKLLQDFITNRVALPDVSCAAFIRYCNRNIKAAVTVGTRLKLFDEARGIFERLLLQQVPPAEVGPATHAEFIRSCALVKEWSLGFESVRQRAMEEMAARPRQFVLTADFFDAVLQLCVSCNRVEEGMQAFEQLLAVNLRPPVTALDSAMTLLAISLCGPGGLRLGSDDIIDSLADEATYFERLTKSALGSDLSPEQLFEYNRKSEEEQQASDKISSALAGDPVLGSLVRRATSSDVASPLPPPGIIRSDLVAAKADEVWLLYQYFELTPTSASVLAYIRVMALADMPDKVISIMEHAYAKEITLTEDIFLWLTYALRNEANAGALANDFYVRMAHSGIERNSQQQQVSLMAMALRGDGQSAVDMLAEHILPQYRTRRLGVELTFTPEMALYALLAMARSRSPTPLMASMAKDIILIGEENHSLMDIREALYEVYLALLARVPDCVSSAHACIKLVLASGCTVTPRMINNILRANANSSAECGGGASITAELLKLFDALPRTYPTAQTFLALEAAVERHGNNDLIQQSWDQLLADAISLGQSLLPPEQRVKPIIRDEKAPADQPLLNSDEDTIALLDSVLSDRPIAVPLLPMPWLRRHHVRWNLRLDEMALSKHGQYAPYRGDWGNVKFGSMSRATVAFGDKNAGVINV